MSNHHFLLVCFPAQGHINPSLQLAHRLTNLGHHVTFATTILANKNINTTTKPFTFVTFSDGFDDQEFPKITRSWSHYFSELNRCGSQFLTNLFVSHQPSRPITFVIYSLMFNWAADVATAFHIPSALLFVQPATLLALYYYYFHGYGDSISNQLSVELPGLPLLSSKDIPSFFSPSSPQASLVPLLKEQVEFLHQPSHSKVLVNTFDALEMEALKAIDELRMIPIGPLIPSDPSFGGEDSCIEWLNSKAKSSVVYVSFGSAYVLPSKQEEEIAHALLESGYSFLWVMIGDRKREKDEEKLKKVEGKGKIVSWCGQMQVLNHGSLGCFMTHCGWNSTVECLASGLPMVGFPQQIDQPTNAKLVEDMWKTGVRVKPNSQGIVERDEIRRCLDLVMGNEHGQNQEILENVNKWKRLATQAIGQGGSSIVNLETFVEEIGKCDC